MSSELLDCDCVCGPAFTNAVGPESVRQLHFPFLGKSHVRFTVSLQEIMATQFKVQNKRVCV